MPSYPKVRRELAAPLDLPSDAAAALPPHAATLQAKLSPSRRALPPHAATLQRKLSPSGQTLPAHAATLQRKRSPGGRALPPHAATVPHLKRAFGAPSDESAAPASQTLQPKLGFELEVPVTLLTALGENVPDKTTFAENEYFGIVGDKSPAAGLVDGKKPTIVEIISKPVDEHANDARHKLKATLTAIKEFRKQLQVMTKEFKIETTLKDVIKGTGLKLTKEEYGSYRLNVASEGRTYGVDTAYVHFTVGVSWEDITAAGLWLDSKMGGSAHQKALKETHQAAQTFISTLIEPLVAKSSDGWLVTGSAARAFYGFCYLAFTNVLAVQRGTVERNIKKNYTPMLSRTAFRIIRKMLRDELYASPAEEFVNAHSEQLKACFKEAITQDLARTYIDDIFNDELATQRKYFGDMKELQLESCGVGNRGKGPPVELRGFGDRLTETEIEKAVGAVYRASRRGFRHNPVKILDRSMPNTMKQVREARTALVDSGFPVAARVALWFDQAIQLFSLDLSDLRFRGEELEPFMKRQEKIFIRLVGTAWALLEELEQEDVYT